jgi:iron complex transport system substrate-binding protein
MVIARLSLTRAWVAAGRRLSCPAMNSRASQSLRIVSLIPSATEIIAALGYGDCLVGRSHECDEPAAVRDLPACTSPAIDTSAESGEIHRQVRQAMDQAGGEGPAAAAALSIYEVDPSLLEALAPDLIVTQSQCAVCAVSEAQVQQAVEQMVTSQPRVVACEPGRLDDIWSDIDRIATALGDRPAGQTLVRRLEDEIQAIADRARTGAERPRVGCLEWLDPLMGCGNWMPELIAMAGGVSVLGQAGEHAQWLTWSQLDETDLDRLIAVPCGFDLERAEAELEAKLYEDRWQRLAPVRAGQLYAADGHQFFNRPGPRLVESLMILAEMIHPELFAPDHKDQAWRPQPSSTTAGTSS